MPSSTPERQARWEADYKAIGFLEACGYKLNRDWTWTPPDCHVRGVEWNGCSPMEADAILYMIEEWDFGGLLNDKGIDCIPWLAKAEQAEG